MEGQLDPEKSGVGKTADATKTTTLKYTMETSKIGDLDYIDSLDASGGDLTFEYSASGAGAFSPLLLERPQDELNSYKRRIDANVEQQREHADLMASLQRKVEDYRRRFVDIEGKLSLRSMDETDQFADLKLKDQLLWVSKDKLSDNEMTRRLDIEQRRAEQLLMQLEQERTQNDQLQNEIQRLRQQFEINIREKERIYQSRERNFAQYLGDEQRKMVDLWAELQRVRQQCSEYKEQTERDLENQRNEFTKVMQRVSGVVRGLSSEGDAYRLFSDVSSESGLDVTQDTILIEAVKRFHESQQGAPPSGLGPELVTELRLARAEDAGLHNELMRKYEESVQRVIELESKDDESHNKLMVLENDLKRAQERLGECQSALRKVYDFANEHKSDSQKRPREASPAKGYIPPPEVVRTVRHVLNTRSNDNLVLQRKLKGAEAQINELGSKIDSMEDSRRRIEKQLSEAKREIANQQKAVEEAQQTVKVLDERVKITEQERTAAENARRHLEDEMRRMREQFNNILADTERRAKDEIEERVRAFEEDTKIRITELNRRIESLLDENKKLKTDADSSKDRLKVIENDYNAIVHKLEDKDAIIKNLNEVRQNLLKELEEHRVRFDQASNEFEDMRNNLHSASKNTVTIEMTIKEMKQQRDDLSKHKDRLTKELMEMEQKLDFERKARDEAEKANQRNLSNIEGLKKQVKEYETDLFTVRRQYDDLDTQWKTNQAKYSGIEISMAAAQKEIEKLSEFNNRLQLERQELSGTKHRGENEIGLMRDRLRKLEQEIERLKQDNHNMEEREHNTRDELKQQINQANLLSRELDEAHAEIEQLRKKFGQLDSDFKVKLEETLKTKSRESDSETIILKHDTEVYETRYKVDLEKLENEKDDLSQRLLNLQDELDVKEQQLNRQNAEINDLKRKLESDVNKIRNEMNLMQTKYRSDFDDEKNNHQKITDEMNVMIEDLRTKLKESERHLGDLRGREGKLLDENNELKERLESILTELDRLKNELNLARTDSEREINRYRTDLQNARNEIKGLNSTNVNLKSQLATADEKLISLNKTITELNNKIRDAEATIRRLEIEIEDGKNELADAILELDAVRGRLHTLNESYMQLQSDHSKAKSDLDTLLRENDHNKVVIETKEAEIDRLERRLSESSAQLKEYGDALDQLRPERDRLQNMCRDKSKQLEEAKQTIVNLETKIGKLRRDLHETSDKLLASDNDCNSMRNTISKLQHDLDFSKEQLVRKSSEYQAALDDLVNMHRTAEDGRVSAVHELEACKFDLADLQSRLSNSEQYLITLQQNCISAESDRDMLQDALRRLQSTITRTVSISRVFKDEGIKLDGKETVQPLQSADKDKFDMHGLDINIQKLLSRIDKLEMERNEYRDAFDRLKKRSGDTTAKISKHETILRTIEDHISEHDDGDKRAMEARLASAKQLLRSQEEALKQRDEERRHLKSKLATFEMQARGKEAQIRQLNELVRNLRKDLESAHGDVRTLRDHEEQWEAQRFHLESKLKDYESESERINLLMTTIETERDSLSERVRDLSGRLQQSDSKCSDMKDELEKIKKDLSRSSSTEIELRRTIDLQTKATGDNQLMKDQLDSVQGDLTNANARKHQLENELMLLRAELREHKQRLGDNISRISELQRHLNDSQNDKKRLNDRLHNLENTITSQRSTESELRQQLSSAINERNSIKNEISELLRRLSKLENEGRVLNGKNKDLEKIRLAMTKRIDMLEAEKRAAEIIIQETGLQRAAIESSLSTLERENKELHRNCAQLQQQISELEMENGNRMIQLTSKQRDDHDRFVQSMKNEKLQIERIIENRERSLKTRITQLENQLNMMRDQLNSERRRRRDITDKLFSGEVNKLNTSFRVGNYELLDQSSYSLGSYIGSPSFGFSSPGHDASIVEEKVTITQSSGLHGAHGRSGVSFDRSSGGPISVSSQLESSRSMPAAVKGESDGSSDTDAAGKGGDQMGTESSSGSELEQVQELETNWSVELLGSLIPRHSPIIHCY